MEEANGNANKNISGSGRRSARQRQAIGTGLKRRVLAYNDKLFVAEHEMVKGWIGKVHSHPHDQVVYVVHGHLRVTCQGATFDVQAGDTFVVLGGIDHGASAIEDSLVIDVFTPCREDYIP
jgi:quercetin dioxygenase-like cupin family protein